MLKVSDLNFFYGEVQTLTNVSLDVGQGEFVALFGPNGHGKSTLLKAICGLLTPSSGRIEYDGQDIMQLPVRDIVNLGLIYIAEDRHLFPELTVFENLQLGAYCKNARARERENLDYVFHLFPKLAKLRKRQAQTLSGGEARMLAIGRGLMSNPRFLAIDEPSLGLAPNIRVEVFKAIEDIRQKGVDILLVEQSTAIACHYADRIYIMEDGKIVVKGTKDEVLNNKEVRRVYLGVH